jgi:hypothetical protein
MAPAEVRNKINIPVPASAVVARRAFQSRKFGLAQQILGYDSAVLDYMRNDRSIVGGFYGR